MAQDDGTIEQQWRDAVAERFCSSYSLVADAEDADGLTSYECECGRFSGDYPNSFLGEAALDEHLYTQGLAWRSFYRDWWAEKLAGVGMRIRASLGSDVDLISVEPRTDERAN